MHRGPENCEKRGWRGERQFSCRRFRAVVRATRMTPVPLGVFLPPPPAARSWKRPPTVAGGPEGSLVRLARRLNRSTLSRRTPVPDRERERTHSSGHAANRGGEPGQLAIRRLPGLRRSSMNAAQTRRSDPHSDGLTASVWHQSSVRFERIGLGQSESPNTSLRMCVTDDLPARQDASQQNRTRVIAKIFRFVGPLGDESPKIQLRRHHVFVQVKHRETVRRIPATTQLPRITRIKRIGPCRIGDTPPDVRIRNRFAPQFQGHACTRSNRNMSRHATTTARVSPCANRFTRDTPPSDWIGLRTTAGIRSRLR